MKWRSQAGIVSRGKFAAPSEKTVDAADGVREIQVLQGRQSGVRETPTTNNSREGEHV